jgi:hypothetical protein
MARSSTAEMQEEPKKKKPNEILQQINDALDQALKTKTFSPETLREFEKRGEMVRDGHDMRQMTPKPTEQKHPVTKAVPTKEMEMSRPAVLAALKLAENLELASSARSLSLGKWLEAGRMA